MATEVIMPKVDMDMTEGKISAWYVKAGEMVEKGQLLFDIETDKATMEVESPASGKIGNINTEPLGSPILVGTPVAWVYAENEAIEEAASSDVTEADPAATASAASEVAEQALQQAKETAAHEVISPCETAETACNLLRATPLARSTAKELGIDLTTIKGSGPNGRVQFKDLPTDNVEQKSTSSSLYLNWITKGANVPLVAIHGFGADQLSWKILSNHFEDIPILGVDLPNHGKSGKQAVMSIPAIAEQIAEALLNEGVCDFHLVGHSLGGAIAAEVAAKVGNRIKSLTLIAPAGLGPEINADFIQGLCRATSEKSLKPWLELLYADPSKLTGSFVATAAKSLEKSENRQALEKMANTLMPDGTQVHSIRRTLAALQLPIKVIWGAQDQILPIKHAHLLPHLVGLHVIQQVGHVPQIESPQIVAENISYQMR